MRKIFGMMLAAVLCMIGASCSHTESPAEVAQKIAQGETLTQTDYTVMINYCGKFAEEAQKLQDQIDNLPVDSPEAVKATDKIAELQSGNEYLTPFFEKITTSKEGEIGAENVKLVNDYAGYEWFSAPEWATIVTDPEVAGIVVDDPGDTSGVIAAPTGEELSPR